MNVTCIKMCKVMAIKHYVFNFLSYCSAPWRKLGFHFISLYLCVCLIYAAVVARNGWVHLSAEQTGKPDHLSFA
jgi:hypothetical protein